MAYNWITIKETSDWVVDYAPNVGRYRVSYFEDGHFKDEVIFQEYHGLVECPNCRVCSIDLATDTNICKVCGAEVDVIE
jgi:hypothetical protein